MQSSFPIQQHKTNETDTSETGQNESVAIIPLWAGIGVRDEKGFIYFLFFSWYTCIKMNIVSALHTSYS